MTSGVPSETAQAQASSGGGGDGASFSSLGIQNTSINEGTGVQLTQDQKVLVDLYSM